MLDARAFSAATAAIDDAAARGAVDDLHLISKRLRRRAIDDTGCPAHRWIGNAASCRAESVAHRMEGRIGLALMAEGESERWLSAVADVVLAE